MSPSPLGRHVGPLAVATGALFTVTQLAGFAITDRSDLSGTLVGWPYRMASLAVLVAFAGLAVAAIAIYLRQAAKSGRLGVVAVVAALTGTMFLAGDMWFETFAVPWYADVLPEILTIKGAGWLSIGGLTSYALFTVGWVLMGIASFRARVFPRVVCLAVIIGGLVGYAAALPPYGAVLGLAIIWLGLAAVRAAALERASDQFAPSVAHPSTRRPAVP